MRYLFIFVGNNGIGAEGAKSIAGALLKNQSITQLDLSKLHYYNIRYLFIFVASNEIGAAGAISIAIALLKNQSLVQLDLSQLHNTIFIYICRLQRD